MKPLAMMAQVRSSAVCRRLGEMLVCSVMPVSGGYFGDVRLEVYRREIGVFAAAKAV